MGRGQPNDNLRVDIEVMKNTIENFKDTVNSLKESFDEFKKDTKEYHDSQSKRYHHFAELATKMTIVLDDWVKMKEEIDDLKKLRTAVVSAMAVLGFFVTMGIIKINRLF